MRQKAISLASILFLLVFSSISFAQEGNLSMSQYQLGSGDRIKISVFGQDDLSMEVRLPDVGTINYPFLGEIKLVGLTADEVEKKIYDGLLGDYLVNPSVSVAIVEYRPFFIDGEVKKFNADVVQSDKVNDLAIIKIFDVNFDGLDNLPYNFKTRSSDVGTKVYAYGYPMALSLMGKEIKITDGIISSKSGFDGDITTYQITAPIQGGNSGGPLFDDKGNFLGINSSGLRKDIADNVGYTIKSSYVLNLIDVLPKSIDLPSSTKLQSLPLTEQIKEISKYVVLVKVK